MLITFVEFFSVNVGAVDSSTGDGYISREVMYFELSFASRLDGSHSYPSVVSSGVEQMISCLFITESMLDKDRKYRTAFFDLSLGHLGVRRRQF